MWKWIYNVFLGGYGARLGKQIAKDRAEKLRLLRKAAGEE